MLLWYTNPIKFYDETVVASVVDETSSIDAGLLLLQSLVQMQVLLLALS